MRIGTATRWIEFTKDPIGPECYVARINSERLSAEALVDFSPNGNPTAFLEDLANNWKGWEGEKKFETYESELIIEASHDGRGHIDLQVYLSTNQEPRNPWNVKALIELEAGDLERLAKEAAYEFKAGR